MIYYSRENLTLYHGSTDDVRCIDINKGKDYKDFGKGFYTTTSKLQARKFARIQSIRKRKPGNVNVYSTSKLLEGLLYKEFKTADIEWLDFVVFNRTHKGKQHPYDIVIGPVADDNTDVVFQAYMSGVYGDINGKSAKEQAIQHLEPENLKDQVFIGTRRAALKLTYIGGYRI